MAIKKSITTDSGIVLEHWHVMSWNVDVPSLSCSVTLGAYVNKAARLAGKKPAEYKTYHLFGDQFPFDFSVGQRPINKIEDTLQALPEFAASTTE